VQYAKIAPSHDYAPAFNMSPLEASDPVSLASNVKLQRPLSRRGNGPPALIIFVPDLGQRTSPGSKKTLDPAPLQKWAEEGFAVVEVVVGDVASPAARDALSIKDACEKATAALTALPECSSKGKIGAIGR
jgi:carboxymethylenebutenolidase